MTDLLPPNATPQERALGSALARVSDVPVPLRDLWNPWTIPAALLPWLAWTLSIDEEWDSARTDQERRAVVAASVELHRTKGTPYAIRRALSAIGHEVVAIGEGLPMVRHDGTGKRDGRDRYDGAARWALFRVAVALGDSGMSRGEAARILSAIDHAKNARSRLHALVLRADLTTARPGDAQAVAAVRVGLAVPARRTGIRDGTRRRGGLAPLPRNGSLRFDGQSVRAGRVFASPVFGENAIRLRTRLALGLPGARMPYLPRDGAVRYDGTAARDHDGPVSVLRLLTGWRVERTAPLGFVVADPADEANRLAGIVLTAPDGTDHLQPVAVTVVGREAVVTWAIPADAAPGIALVSALSLRRADGSAVCALPFDPPLPRLPSDPWSGAWSLINRFQRDASMTTIYLPAYYDGVRRFLATGDPALRLTHVAVGTGSDPDAETLTDPVSVAVGDILFPPDSPRRMLIHWTVPRDLANGLLIREIGLLRADGTLVARVVRASPIEKTADMEIGDFWQLDV